MVTLPGCARMSGAVPVIGMTAEAIVSQVPYSLLTIAVTITDSEPSGRNSIHHPSSRVSVAFESDQSIDVLAWALVVDALAVSVSFGQPLSGTWSTTGYLGST